MGLLTSVPGSHNITVFLSGKARVLTKVMTWRTIMVISDYLKPEQIKLSLEARTKQDAIVELSELLRPHPHVKDLEKFVEETFKRENFSTTGIGHEVAIPHARTDAVSDIVIALGRSSQGIEFDSLDGSPVKLVFLIGTPKSRHLSTYLSLLAHLTRLLDRETFRKKLLEATSAEAIIDAFRKVEEP